MPPADPPPGAGDGWSPTETARRVRDAAATLVERAHEEAGTQGLCGEGAFEYALDRLRHADPAELLGPDDPHARNR